MKLQTVVFGGIGMDDTFLMLAAWRKTSVHASVEHRVQETYAEAAVSMTITSLTNVLSFLIGATSSFRVLNIFCMYSGLSILFLYLYQITFFGGWMAFYGRLEKANRHTFTMRKIITYNEAAKQGRGTWYRMLCTGGHEPDDDFDEGAEGATNHAVMLFFRNCVAKTLTKPVAKIMVGIIFICYVAGGLYGVLQLEEGLSLKRLVSDYSYYVDFYDKRFSEFMDYPYRVPIVVAGHVDYSDRTVQDDMERLLERIENHTFYANSNFTDSWLRKFLKFAEMANNHGANIIDLSNETTFNENLRGVLNSGDNNKNALDVVFDDGGRIIASRFIVQIYDLKKLPDLKDCMLFLRHVFKEEFPNYNLTAFNPVFSFAELLIGATNTAIQTVGIAAVVMLIIALIMIPESKCAIYVGFSLVSIELGVLGYMSLWGVNLDAISVGCLVMCIGFSVDFSAHVTHSFISSPESTNILKLQDAIEKAGLPILQGATSSVLGVIAMLKIPAYAYLIFVKTIFLVMIFGAVHGILFLPVLLTLTESNGEKKKTDSKQAAKRIASPQTDLSLIRRDEFSDSSFRQDEGNDYVSFMGFKLHDAKKKNRVSGSSSDESSGIGMDPKSSSSESVDSKEVDEFVDADEPLNNGSSRLMSQVSHDSCL
ncbi:unnamed protein product [Notodromas monacha]|uniref:SSD domain-containing protein n=1 Tax=Notodromas monacha TaxID=399045 RepID=A0A7R9BCN3_9CRUS|nr:unnamed protein product [Notodromas monacha]CAG0912884.1 unnamed protein product [Notodromas monacha]